MRVARCGVGMGEGRGVVKGIGEGRGVVKGIGEGRGVVKGMGEGRGVVKVQCKRVYRRDTNLRRLINHNEIKCMLAIK